MRESEESLVQGNWPQRRACAKRPANIQKYYFHPSKIRGPLELNEVDFDRHEQSIGNSNFLFNEFSGRVYIFLNIVNDIYLDLLQNAFD